jgi:hypothetical protein
MNVCIAGVPIHPKKELENDKTNFFFQFQSMMMGIDGNETMGVYIVMKYD